MAMPYHNKHYPMSSHGNAIYHNKQTTSIPPSTTRYSIHGKQDLTYDVRNLRLTTIVRRKVVYNLRLTYKTYV